MTDPFCLVGSLHRIRIASNTRRKAKERAIDTMVYAERMIMRSL
jgi:hypothetical protein